MKSIRIQIEGDPVPKKRPRVVRGKAYTPEATKAWETLIGHTASLAMAQADLDPFSGDCAVYLYFHQVDSKRNRSKDLDNLVKAVLDAINGIVYIDDANVHYLSARRDFVKDSPGVEVRVYEITPG